MNKLFQCFWLAIVMWAIAPAALADLQNVAVGGSLRIRGNWFSQGDLDFDKDVGNDALYFEQRTSIHLGADFTDNVRGFIEIDHYGDWGTEFRGLSSDGLLTGADGVGAIAGGYSPGRGIPSIDSDNKVALYQGYVEIRDAFGAPIDLRIGRAEMQHGDEFLVGNNDTGPAFRGLSFDGVWLTYRAETIAITGFWTRLATDADPPIESSGDTNFSGVYATYSGIESMVIDGYYYFVHQARTAENTPPGFENATAFHTIGIHFAGDRAAVDWSGDAAGQFGDSGGPNSGDMTTFGAQGIVGYTFDVAGQPRLFFEGAMLDGNEPKDGQDHEVFNRLFSDKKYSVIIDQTDLSNFWTLGAGAGLRPTESLTLVASCNYFRSLATFDEVGFGEERYLGIEVSVEARYDYSEDLYFEAGYARFFAGTAMENSARNAQWGLAPLGGLGESDDIDYVYLETGVEF